jgi:hypothetical protein
MLVPVLPGFILYEYLHSDDPSAGLRNLKGKIVLCALDLLCLITGYLTFIAVLFSDDDLCVTSCSLQHTYASIIDTLTPCNLFGVWLDIIPSPWRWRHLLSLKFRCQHKVLHGTTVQQIFRLLMLKLGPLLSIRQPMINRYVCRLLLICFEPEFLAYVGKYSSMCPPKKFSLHRFFRLVIGLESRVCRYIPICALSCIASPKWFFVLGRIPLLLKV